MHPGHPAQLEEGDQVDEVAAQASQGPPAHARVTHPAVLRVQETPAAQSDVHQVDALAHPALADHLLHGDHPGVEPEAVGEDGHQGGVILTSLDHAEALQESNSVRDEDKNLYIYL